MQYAFFSQGELALPCNPSYLEARTVERLIPPVRRDSVATLRPLYAVGRSAEEVKLLYDKRRSDQHSQIKFSVLLIVSIRGLILVHFLKYFFLPLFTLSTPIPFIPHSSTPHNPLVWTLSGKCGFSVLSWDHSPPHSFP